MSLTNVAATPNPAKINMRSPGKEIITMPYMPWWVGSFSKNMRNACSLVTACLTVESLFVLTQKERNTDGRPPEGVVGDVSENMGEE